MTTARIFLKRIFLILYIAFITGKCSAITTGTWLSVQDSTPLKKAVAHFDKFNHRVERLFTIIPIPVYAYSTEAGHIFGLTKYNLIRLSRKDKTSKPSKLTGVLTYSTEKRINANFAAELIFKRNNYIVLTSFNYRKFPEYLYGIGNNISFDKRELISLDRIKFTVTPLKQVAKNFYAGPVVDVANYFAIHTVEGSQVVTDTLNGSEGGINIGLGMSVAYDTRENRYNPRQGVYVILNKVYYQHSLGSKYTFNRFDADARTYFNPWLKHVVALQATTTFIKHNAPFYELAMLGGENQMRGYYKGALRDNVLIDSQVEYRMPVWNIFGVTAWAGTGEVAHSYSKVSVNGLWFSYGAGLRMEVNQKNHTNIRVDFGFGPHGVHGAYINFAEAF